MKIENDLMFTQREGTKKKAIVEKGNPNKKFIPIDEISDPNIDVEEEMDNYIENKKEEAIEELPSEEEILKAQIIDELNKKKEIGFIRNNEGAAHVGPEFPNEEKYEEILNTPAEEHEMQPSFLSKAKALRARLGSAFSLYRREVRDNYAKGKDNLKTISENQKARLARKETRGVLHDSEN